MRFDTKKNSALIFYHMAAFLTALLIAESLRAACVAAGTPTAKITKANGQTATVRLRAVRLDPAHVAVVKKRTEASRERAKAFETQRPSSHIIPREAFTPVRDQGERGLCAYFATLGVVESHYAKTEQRSRLNLSEHCLAGLRNWMFDTKFQYADSPVVRPDPDGDEPHSIARTISKFGVPSNGLFGGVDCRYDDRSEDAISLNQYFHAFDRRSGSRPYGRGLKFDIDTNPTLDRIVELISKDIAVEVSIVVIDAFFETPDWRYARAKIAGGHSIVLTGYKKDAQGNVVFKFRNSWGASWGRHGYGTIDDQTLLHSWAISQEYDTIISLR